MKSLAIHIIHVTNQTKDYPLCKGSKEHKEKDQKKL